MPKTPAPFPRRRVFLGLFAIAGLASAVGFWATGGRAAEDYALLALALWLGVLFFRTARGHLRGLEVLAMRTLGAFLLFTAYLAIRHLGEGLWPSLLWTPLIYPGAYATLPPEAARVFLLRYFFLLFAVSTLAFGLSGDFAEPGRVNTYLQWLASQAGLWILSSRIFEMGRRAAHAEEEARTDPLTGARNRRAFLEALTAELAQARRHRAFPVLVMIDVDGLKQVNDERGHAAGDRLLRSLASRLRTALREGDLLARLGGDEFAVLLYRSSRDEALAVAERLRRAAALVPARISLGVSRAVESDDAESLLARADRALYRAKRAGGDRVEWAAPVS